MLKVLQWPFKSYFNFSTSIVGAGLISFWVFTIYSQDKFNQPIIAESVKLLGKNAKIKQIIGFPLSYSYSIFNKFQQKPEYSYFSFKVAGPRTSTEVQLNSSARLARDIYPYDNKNQKISSIEQSIQQMQNQFKDLQEQISKTTSKRQKQLMLQKAETANKIQKLQQQLIEQKYAIIERQNRFFVPSKQIYTKLSTPNSKESPEVLPPDVPLWGVDNLQITLPNRSRLKVYPEPPKTLQQKEEIVKSTDILNVPTYGLLHKRVSIDISQLTKEEVLEYGRQKTNFMYSKYNSYRILSMLLFASAMGSLFVYKNKKIIRSIKGSILEDEVKRIVSHHPTVNKILRQKRKEQAEFDTLIGGGLSDDHFDCIMYLKSLTNGRIEFAGRYLQDMNEYHYDKIVLKYREKEHKREIDLLK